MTDNGKRYVTWGQLTAMIVAQLALNAGMNWTFYESSKSDMQNILGNHAAQPHVGAAADSDITTLREDMTRSLQSIQLDIREIRNAVSKSPQ